jgi:hypothetical protein
MHNKRKFIKDFFIICFQRLYAYFYCKMSMDKPFDHAPKFPSCVSKLKANGSTCHPFIGGQNHVSICDVGFGILCYNFF